MRRRSSIFVERASVQRSRFNLPAFPTTTIGSFPQTAEVRNARAAHGKGAMSDAQYEQFLKEETARAVRWQEEIGLDVLVHGEFERNDMVQYFGEQLVGFHLHQARLGAILRLALRPAADPLWRRLASRADDGRVVALRPVADREADEGNAHRTGDHSELVVCARRYPTQRRPAGRSRSRSATKSPTLKRPERE